MTDDATASVPSLPGRLLYGGVLAYMGIDGFRNNGTRVEIAREKGVPLPEIAVPVATGLLTVASLGIVFWRKPRLAAAAVAAFFLGTTPKIHDFWDLDGEARHDNRVQFLKNGALLGAALVLMEDAAGRRSD